MPNYRRAFVPGGAGSSRSICSIGSGRCLSNTSMRCEPPRCRCRTVSRGLGGRWPRERWFWRASVIVAIPWRIAPSA